ncbi:MAG: hypothetical protein R3286_09965 [Gammaproteobacteria bacterium]|nr:hypothetical protein [Gammaproteobacteria bacterium]
MKRFADAYERALFPLRGRRADGQGMGPSELDIAVGAGWYRLVCAVEALVDALSATARRLRARPQAPSAARPLGCG